MDANTTYQLLLHRGHAVHIVTYGASDENVTLECLDCMMVIISQDIDLEMEREIERIESAKPER
jgi:Ser-tRNA(Ala) deacylase AlaX